MYTTLAAGDESILIPNNVVLTMVVTPLEEPDSVNLRARLRANVKPSQVQGLLEETVSIPTRDAPHIMLEEVDGDEVVVRIAATPAQASDGPRLADEILEAVAAVTREA
jgi:hypothetical protein